jgi:hypothetical protein
MSASSHLSSISTIIEFLLREHADEVAKVVELCRHISPTSFHTSSDQIHNLMHNITHSFSNEDVSIITLLSTLSKDTSYMQLFGQLIDLYEIAQSDNYDTVDVTRITEVVKEILSYIRKNPTYEPWVSHWKKHGSKWFSEICQSLPSHIYNEKTKATIHTKLVTLFVSVIANSAVHFRKLRQWDTDTSLLNGLFTTKLKENPQDRILLSSMLWYMVSAFMGIIVYYNAIFTNTDINLYRCGGESGQWFLNICYVYIDHLVDGDVTLGYKTEAQKKRFLQYVQTRLHQQVEPFDQPTGLMHKICCDIEMRIPKEKSKLSKRIWDYIYRIFECEQIGIQLEKSSKHLSSICDADGNDNQDTLLSALLMEKGMTTVYLTVLFVIYENELELESDDVLQCYDSSHSLYELSYKLGVLCQYVDDLNDFHSDLEANSMTYAVHRYRNDGNLDRYIQEVNAYMSHVSDTIGGIPMMSWLLYICQTGILYGCIKNITYITSDTVSHLRQHLKRRHIDESQVLRLRQKKNSDGLRFLSNAFIGLM